VSGRKTKAERKREENREAWGKIIDTLYGKPKGDTMPKKRTIGADPLDAVVPEEAATKASRRGLAVAGTRKPKEKKPAPRKERLTVHVPVDLVDRVKNAVFWTPGLTLAGLAEDALAAAVVKLEKAENKGKPFKARNGELKGGRPLK
jgi:hypothetical protein